jgi:hypothetical protein
MKDERQTAMRKFTARNLGAFMGAAFSAAAMAAPAGQSDTRPPVRFQEHLLDTIPGAYHAAIVDINGDGKPDVVAISESNNEITWYENPTWERHLISAKLARNIDVTGYDIRHNGKPALFIASEFDMGHSTVGGRVMMLLPGDDPHKEWTPVEVGLSPTAHRIRWADWDGNGKKELVVTPIVGIGAHEPDWAEAVSIRSYRFKGFDKSGSPQVPAFEMREVDRSLHMSHGVCVCDFDGDHRDDLLVASFEGITWFKPQGKGANRTWLKTHIAGGHPDARPTGRGCSEIDRGWLKGKKPFLVTIDPWHGNEVAVYLPPAHKGELWSRTVIDSSIGDGHALECVDIDGDGQSEIIAGGRGGTHSLYCYKCVDGKGLKWERSVIDEGHMSSAGVAAADVFGKGRMDLVAPARVTGEVKLYENLGK